jgi:hypothetical protein
VSVYLAECLNVRARTLRRVIMRILRQADLAVTMEIYAKASSKATREALRRLGESLG